MSLTATLKRSLPCSSFDSDPHKRARMSLRRTHSYISLSDLPNQQQNGTAGSIYITASKELRASIERSIAASLAPIINPAPMRKSRAQCQTSPYSPPRTTYTAPQSATTPCTTSSPVRSRPRRFPREPDLHRLAIQRCMRATSEGQKILNMGPRLAVDILTATRELERMLDEGELSGVSHSEDVVMEDWQVVNH